MNKVVEEYKNWILKYFTLMYAVKLPFYLIKMYLRRRAAQNRGTGNQVPRRLGNLGDDFGRVLTKIWEMVFG